MNAKFVTVRTHWLAQQLADQQQQTGLGGNSDYMCSLDSWRYKRVLVVLLSEVYPGCIYPDKDYWQMGRSWCIKTMHKDFITAFCDLPYEEIAPRQLRLDFISRLLIRPDRLLVVPINKEGGPS